ncbi:DUF4287 domain-containing protein [Sphingobacterium spiritivorum]|uniref:DUF4287 domain-containing protein n=1 Tax=Sphingobacterium spiritivorum TaxID=258 RepID=UPI001917F928|nr:DUF4287 domain-containing protein [Sphingobacterium spiritivorum]QQT24621.1 DUF4287 domain-containing protein [Sphingobacterium spiritivorum]
MSFQAYLDNIETKTGKSPEDLQALATEMGFVENGKLKSDIKAAQVLEWLKTDFDLGHGHAMSIYAYFKGKRS